MRASMSTSRRGVRSPQTEASAPRQQTWMPEMSLSQGLDGRSRSGRVTAALAHDLLTRKPGDRLPTLAEYARRYGVGNGSVDKALRVLQDHQAVRIEARGHLGSFIVASDPGALWAASGRGAIVGAVPRPSSTEFEGIMAGLAASFANAGAAFTPLFISGSRQRLAALLDERAHFTILSEHAAHQAMREVPVRIARALKPESYYPEGSIVIVARPGLDDPQQAQRVAIDLTSHDHEALTRTQFGSRSFVDVPYPTIPDRLADGAIDAAVWHRTSRSTLTSAAGWRLHPVATLATQAALQAMSRGVVVTRAGDSGMQAVLETIIDPTLIELAQAEARDGYLPAER